MVSLTKFLKTGTKAAIDQITIEGDKREHLGMSQIGHECPRYLWYQFRWAYTEVFSSRHIRLFGRGHKEEPIIIAELAKVGVEVSGEQDNYRAVFGHYSGSKDGEAIGVLEAPKTKHLAEFKTINDRGYKELVKKGVQKSKPIYYGQMQAYMKYGKYTRALFIAVNKNDDSWYVERVYFDKGYAEDLERKAEFIIFSGEPPKRDLPPGWYACRWCAAREVCEGRAEPDMSCRTCKHSLPHPDAKWVCRLTGEYLWVGMQRKGCEKYECYEI